MKKATNDKVMEEALQAAVARMGSGASSGGGATPSLDPVGLLMTALPKLLEGRSDNEDQLSDRFDELQKEELQPIKEQLLEQAKMLGRIYSAQKVLLRELRAVQAVQSALGGAVTNLSDQMARIEIIEESVNDDFAEERSPHPAFDAAVRGRERAKPRRR